MTIIDALKQGKIVEMKFEKIDGTIREMTCCNGPNIVGVDYEFKGGTPKSENVVSVWDINAGAWRSFRKDSVVEWTAYDPETVGC